MTVDQQFQDWSPASIFGATTSTKQATEPPPSRSDRNDISKSRPASRSSMVSPSPPPQPPKRTIRTPVSTTNPQEGKRRESLKVNVVSSELTTSEEIVAQLAQDRAARTIQKHLRVHQLYCQEKASALQVVHLRDVLMATAASQLQKWYHQCHKRHVLLVYLTEFHRMEGRIAYLLDQTLQKKMKITEERIIKQKERRQRVDEEKKLIQETIQRKARAFIATRKLRFFLYMLLMSKRYARASAAKRKLQKQEQSAQSHATAATKIQLQYRNYHARRLFDMKRARRAQISLGLLRLGDILAAHRKKQTIKKWWDFILSCRLQKEIQRQQQEVAGRVLQRSFRFHLARIQRQKIRKQVICLQSHTRKWLIRKQNDRKHHAAIVIQKQWRGFFTRKKFKNQLMKLRDRFKCSNCGLMEPGGEYCKNCGRKRVNGTGQVPERLMQRYNLSSLERTSKVVFSLDLTKPNVSVSLQPCSIAIGRTLSPRIQKATLKISSSSTSPGIQKLKRPSFMQIPSNTEGMSNNRFERELELQEIEKQKKNQMFGLSPTKIGGDHSSSSSAGSSSNAGSNLVVEKTKVRAMDLNDSRSIGGHSSSSTSGNRSTSHLQQEQKSLALLQHLKRLEKNQQVIARNNQC